jgi:hypothetical protein
MLHNSHALKNALTYGLKHPHAIDVDICHYLQYIGYCQELGNVRPKMYTRGHHRAISFGLRPLAAVFDSEVIITSMAKHCI